MVTKMSLINKTIVDDILALPSSARVELVELLMNSLGAQDKEVDALWATEAESRIDAYEKGLLRTVSLDTVLAKYKA
jgi:putative addiction module component (TIGR02574 family)